MIYVETWDETKPAGSRARSLGDDDIREGKRAIRERLATDHDFRADESGIDTIGYHKAVHLMVETSDPTKKADMGILYTKDVSSKAELHFIDEDGHPIQITSGGQFASRINNPLGLIAMWYGTIATIPTGWVLCNGSNSAPDLRDKFIVGARQDDNGLAKTLLEGSLAQTGGATSHSHTGSGTQPTHTHTTTFDARWVDTGGYGYWQTSVQVITSSASGNDAVVVTVNSATEVPPYYALAFIMKN